MWQKAHESNASALQSQLPGVQKSGETDKALVSAIHKGQDYKVFDLVKEDLKNAKETGGDFSSIKSSDNAADSKLGTNKQNALRSANLGALDNNMLKLYGDRLNDAEKDIIKKDMAIQTAMTKSSLVDQVALARDAKHDQRLLDGMKHQNTNEAAAARGSILNDKIGRPNTGGFSIEQGDIKTASAREKSISDAIASSRAVAETANRLLCPEKRMEQKIFGR